VELSVWGVGIEELGFFQEMLQAVGFAWVAMRWFVQQCRVAWEVTEAEQALQVLPF